MKKHHSINHFTGREQQALLQLKNKIVTLYKPLIVYLIGCRSSSQLNRNCMATTRTEERWTYSCDVLVVLPEGASLPENAVQELKSLDKMYGNIQLMAHAVDFVVTQLKEVMDSKQNPRQRGST